MPPVIFESATAVEQALAWKEAHGVNGRFLAGGTDLLVSLRQDPAQDRALAFGQDERHLEPVCVLDLSRLEQLRRVEVAEEGLLIGALATHTQLMADRRVRTHAALLARACATIGSPQIRNRGTVGGNLCNASPCADTAPALIALDAELILQSSGGTRRIGVEEALEAPYRTALREAELLTHVWIPVPDHGGPGSDAAASGGSDEMPRSLCRGAFVKLGRRNALAVSRMSVAVVLREDAHGRLADTRVAAGSVAPTPRRFRDVEAQLNGERPSEALFEEAGRRLAEAMIAVTGQRWSTPYKEPVVAALLVRALQQAEVASRP